jgi:FkbM family methyltransferase
MQLEEFGYINTKDKKLVKLFLNTAHNRFILGINKWTNSILEHIKVDGIIDDYTDKVYYNEYKIYKMTEIPSDAIVVSATMGGIQTAKKKLDSLNIKNIDYFAFFKYSNLKLENPPFICDFKDDFLNNKVRYEAIYNHLSDLKSKEIFQKVINFKITFDLSFMKGFINDISNQYFEKDIYKLPLEPVFVDGGGYIGDTSIEFIKKYPNFKKIFLFEPMEINMNIAKNNLKQYHNIKFFSLGLSKDKDTLYFQEDNASSTISKNGNIKVIVNSLDNIVNEKVDLLKLDIEGAEQDALIGAKKIIKKYQPILAICIYHKAEDWYKIPEYIFSIYNDYKIYIRHYMEGISETVMYFVPPKYTRGYI